MIVQDIHTRDSDRGGAGGERERCWRLWEHRIGDGAYTGATEQSLFGHFATLKVDFAGAAGGNDSLHGSSWEL